VTHDGAASGQNDRMSRQQGGGNGNGEVARGAGYAALLGAVLIGVAVVIGIVLLQIGDRDDNGPASATKTTIPKTTTTTLPKTGSTVKQSGTTVATPVRPPSAVGVIVLNGGAAAGKAGDMAAALKVKGYTNMGKATDWPKHTQTGNSVYCRAGLEREGPALAVAVGPNAKLHIPYPTTGGPPDSASHDCVVVVGAPG
jgi:LytR cell envelope-related transcriptional attenuator